MKGMESWIANYLLNAAWQVPLLFAAAWLAERLLRAAEPHVRHRVWVSALLLQVALPACSISPEHLASAVTMLRSWIFGTEHSDTAQVTVALGAGYVRGGVHAAPLLLIAILCVYATTVLVFATRLALAMYRTAALRRHARTAPMLRESCARYARVFSVPVPRLAMSDEVPGPVTLGVWRHMILFPAEQNGSLAGDDMDAALAHEFAHIQRRDFAKNLAYEVISLPLAFHPLLWLTRRRIAESREMVCDAMAAEVLDGPQSYARSLLRLASEFSLRRPAVSTKAIGIFDANTFENFERRIMNLTGKKMELRGLRRVVMLTLVGVVAAGACTSALALRMQVASGAAEAPVAVQVQAPAPAVQIAAPRVQVSPHAEAAPQHIIVALPRVAGSEPVKTFTINVAPKEIAAAETDPATNLKIVRPLDSASIHASEAQAGDDALQVRPGVMAGNLVTKVAPVYPPDAKVARIQGAVVLDAVIGKDGAIRELKVESGPEELQQSAMTAVKQWVYKPYLLNGNPVEVETKITVNYSLSN